MIKYRIIKANDEALHTMWKENWELVSISDSKMYFMKKIVSKQDREEKQLTKSPEFIEFAKKYYIIKDSGLSDEKLIAKYNKLIDKHQEIMNWLDKYIRKIKAENIAINFILMASTFISQERWKDEFTIMENRVWFAQKWMLPYLQDLPEERIQFIVNKVREREKKYNKDCTEWVLQNIINPN